MGEKFIAHRAVKTLLHGPPPAGKHVACHACDNPVCCNPNHIFWGSVADNNLDSRLKGRHRIGSKRPESKLTESAVVEILSSTLRHEELAAKYGVSRSCVQLVRKRKTWRHVEAPCPT